MAIKKLPPPKKIKKLDAEMVKYTEEAYDNRPRLSIDETELKDVKDWKVKGKYKVVMELEMMGSHIMDYGKDKGKIKGEFKVVGIGLEE